MIPRYWLTAAVGVSALSWALIWTVTPWAVRGAIVLVMP